MADRPKWVLANTVVPSTSLIKKNLMCKISRRLERGIVRWKPHTGSGVNWGSSWIYRVLIHLWPLQGPLKSPFQSTSQAVRQGLTQLHIGVHWFIDHLTSTQHYTTLNTCFIQFPSTSGKILDNQYLPCPLAKEIKTIHQRGDGMTRRRPATSASIRWRKCLHLRRKKNHHHPPLLSWMMKAKGQAQAISTKKKSLPEEKYRSRAPWKRSTKSGRKE